MRLEKDCKSSRQSGNRCLALLLTGAALSEAILLEEVLEAVGARPWELGNAAAGPLNACFDASGMVSAASIQHQDDLEVWG